MKMKTLAAMCKRDGAFYLYDRVNEDGEVTEQWMGNGNAAFPLECMPYLTEENLIALYDLTEKQCENIFFHHSPLPSQYNFGHADPNEVILDKEKITLGYNNRIVRPIVTRSGLEFINVEWLTPLADVADDLELYERRTAKGGTYFAAKRGFELVGVIMPMNIVEEKLVESVETLAVKLRTALIEKNAQNAAQSESEVESKGGNTIE